MKEIDPLFPLARSALKACMNQIGKKEEPLVAAAAAKESTKASYIVCTCMYMMMTALYSFTRSYLKNTSFIMTKKFGAAFTMETHFSPACHAVWCFMEASKINL